MTALFVSVLVNQGINSQTYQNHHFSWSTSSDSFQKTLTELAEEIVDVLLRKLINLFIPLKFQKMERLYVK